MTKHTPGPWRVTAAPLNPGVSTRWIEVYSVDPEDDVAQATGGNLKTAQANARLIAAAPDLLAAALAMQCADVTTDEIERARDLLDEAIAKAKGGE